MWGVRRGAGLHSLQSRSAAVITIIVVMTLQFIVCLLCVPAFALPISVSATPL